MGLGCDLGMYNWWRRAVFHMSGTYIDMDTPGWPTKIISFGTKLFEQMTLPQFYGWLQSFDKDISEDTVNKLISKLGVKSMKERRNTIKKQYAEQKKKAEELQDEDALAKLEPLEAKLDTLNQNISMLYYIYCYIFY